VKLALKRVKKNRKKNDMSDAEKDTTPLISVNVEEFALDIRADEALSMSVRMSRNCQMQI
jgi:hypothetical protein